MELVLCKATQSVGEQEVQQRTDDTPLGGLVLSQCGEGVVANPHSLWSARQEVQDPVAEHSVQAQGIELGGNNGVEC